MKRNLEIEWVNVDFRPSTVPGWRVVHLDTSAERGHSVSSLAGWLIQEERFYYRDTQKPAEHTDGPSRRRVVPAYYNGGGQVENAAEDDGFWGVLEPGMRTPTAEEEASERARRMQRAPF
jgi:hypothetical protein